MEWPWNGHGLAKPTRTRSLCGKSTNSSLRAWQPETGYSVSFNPRERVLCTSSRYTTSFPCVDIQIGVCARNIQ
eukprot:8637080-Lingulodinium_polyedra.AAC.1